MDIVAAQQARFPTAFWEDSGMSGMTALWLGPAAYRRFAIGG